MKKTLKKLWQDESAQGATEYILMLVVVVAIAVALKEPLMNAISGKVDGLKGQIDSFQ